ncbi:MAG: alpha/beta fold hydrolase [Woeseiaceae bacterium]|nr:alpha/beta fold hydrolase [Woeseiaceae bacterium]
MRCRLTALAGLLCLASISNALELEDCRISAGPSAPGINARCGTLVTPEDPASPDGKTIELQVAVVPALDLDPQPDPVVPIAGGPGGSSIEMYATQRGAFEALRRTRDILLVDQRGTGQSSLMDCESDDELVQGSYSDELTIQLTQECLEALPHDPRFFTTSVAVRDLESVREALGYPNLNLYGVSYGTRVAQHYARRYPETTRSVVIDGVIPSGLALGPDIALESQEALAGVFDRCAEEPACNEAFPGLQDTLSRVLSELSENPVEVTVSGPVSGSPDQLTVSDAELAVAIRLLLYDPNSIALIPLMVNEAGKGNLTPLSAAFQMVAESLSGSMAVGMHNSVVCTEDVPFYDDELIDYAALDRSYMGPDQLSALKAICSVWPSGFIDEDFREPLRYAGPVLLLSGDADPITPPDYAVEAMGELSNPRHLELKHQGHGVIGVGCMPRLVADFVDTRDAQGIDEECLGRAFVMPFFVDFSGPTP